MRLASFVVLMLLSACGGTVSPSGMAGQTAAVPDSSGGDTRRDGFYDGGVFDPDLTRRNLPVPE